LNLGRFVFEFKREIKRKRKGIRKKVKTFLFHSMGLFRGQPAFPPPPHPARGPALLVGHPHPPPILSLGPARQRRGRLAPWAHLSFTPCLQIVESFPPPRVGTSPTSSPSGPPASLSPPCRPLAMAGPGKHKRPLPLLPPRATTPANHLTPLPSPWPLSLPAYHHRLCHLSSTPSSLLA
jgi:hypothetical protein